VMGIWRNLLRRLASLAKGRPLLTVGVVAGVVRLVAVAVGLVLGEASMVKDENQYLAVAEASAAGRLDVFWVGYGRSLYDSTWVFTGQVDLLFRAFGPVRLLGLLLSAGYGVLAAVLTTVVASRVVRTSFAVLAGLVVALLPSQVFFSAAVVRESLIWTCLILAAFFLAEGRRAARPIDVALTLVGTTTCFLLLEGLRAQTAFLSLWCMAGALVLGRGLRSVRAVAAVALLVVAPLLAGGAPGGVDFLDSSFKRLGLIRTYMALDAESAFVDIQEPDSFVAIQEPGSFAAIQEPGAFVAIQEPGSFVAIQEPGSFAAIQEPAPVVTAPGSGGPSARPTVVDGGVRSTIPVDILDRDVMVDEYEQVFVVSHSGQRALVLTGLAATLDSLPRGLVAVSLLPFPWSYGTSMTLNAAAAESLLWVVLYVLAFIGAWHGRRAPTTYFPVFLVGAVMVSSAVTQGNLGTAFRHRGQVLSVLAVLAAIGIQYLWDRRSLGEARTGNAERGWNSEPGRLER